MMLKINYQYGKEGSSENFYSLIDNGLNANEIVKIRVLNNVADPIREVAFDIASNTSSLIVQIVGHVITLYRQSKNKIYTLPR